MFYNFWSGAAAFVYCLFVFPNVVDGLTRRGPATLTRVAAALSVAAGLYVFAIGAYLAVGWSNPFAGKDVASAVHNPKGWIVVALLVVWPYTLMLVGALGTFMGWTAIRRSRSRKRPA